MVIDKNLAELLSTVLEGIGDNVAGLEADKATLIKQLEQREERIKDLENALSHAESRNIELLSENMALEKRNTELVAEVEKLKAKIADMENVIIGDLLD